MRRATNNLLTMGTSQYGGWAWGGEGCSRGAAALPVEPAASERPCPGSGSKLPGTAQAGSAPNPTPSQPGHRAASAVAPHGPACRATSGSEGPQLALEPPSTPGRPPAASPATAHLRTPRVLLSFPPQASGSDLLHHPISSPPSPRPLGAGTAPFRVLFPASFAPQCGVTSALPGRALESGSHGRAGSVPQSGARPVDDNKFVAQRRWRCPLQPRPQAFPSPRVISCILSLGRLGPPRKPPDLE